MQRTMGATTRAVARRRDIGAIDGSGSTMIDWPSREQWAQRKRTAYGDLLDDLRVSRVLADYATPGEIEANHCPAPRALCRSGA
jgi:hypothetical protein